MANKQDRDRKDAKAAAVVRRLAEVHEHSDLLIPMLDEYKLDMLILALGIGAVTLENADAT